ncbi:transposase [Halomarina ordinaria]|uniref:Transposase n=1 Tax=Halomarina ordinaria TaxID=3033939 RepID=A0ABD5UGD5_9EURY|nr:transposase [Halomarina sp. PSRA2]
MPSEGDGDNVAEPTALTDSDIDSIVENLAKQTEELCLIHDHITRVIAALDISGDVFSNYDNPNDATFSLEGIVKLFLYKEALEITQQETADRLRGSAFVYIRFDLCRAPSQGGISHFWRNRFTQRERTVIERSAHRIRECCTEHGFIDTTIPALDPEDVVPEEGIGEDQICEAVKLATELGFDEFSAGRASNFKYPLEAFFERQGFMNFSNLYTTSPQRMFDRESYRTDTPHGSTHHRTMKKVATPNPETTLDEYEGGRRTPEWKRIRDTILPAFHRGVENQLDGIAGRDRQGIRQPVHAALDITVFPFYVSPFRDEAEIEWNEEPVISKSGREVYPKADYPEMVSGVKDSNKKKTERGYKFATLTIVGPDTPIVIGIEPVRDERWWEKADDDVDVERTSRVEVVERLLDQAEQHVEINKLFCDREFDVHVIRDIVAHRHEDKPDIGGEAPIQYVIGKSENSNEDTMNIVDVIENTVYNSRIEHVEGWYGGRMHKLSIIYVPGHDDDDNDGYSMFTVNGWVDEDRAQALVGQYRQRWTIENQYKSIKAHFLPQTASTDYRIRFLYFVIGVILHNVWRLANFVLRDVVSVNLGESPPMPAKEVVQLIAKFLFDPGDSVMV